MKPQEALRVIFCREVELYHRGCAGLDVRKYVIIRGGDDMSQAYYFYGHFG